MGLGARLGGLAAGPREDLEAAGLELGLAFQAVDDLLDAGSTREELGKTPGKDRAQGKLTVVSVRGEQAAAAAAEAHLERALALLPDAPAAGPLRELARSLVRRRS
jgi:geranylgeranyl pyrophosphate synthase